jgi:CDP-diglyceride synthetase
VTRVLSGAVLLVLAVSVVWLSDDAVFFAVAALLVVLGVLECLALARASGVDVPRAPAVACRSMSSSCPRSWPSAPWR